MSGVIARRGMMVSHGRGNVPPDNQIWYDAASQVTLYSSTNVVSHTFDNGRGVITFGSNITNVSTWLRETAITNVYLPSGVTSIGAYAFSGCTSLALISLPSGVTSIGSGSFTGCTSLALTSLPSGVTSIGSASFSGCTSLALTSLPSGVTRLYNNAFNSCQAITSLTVPIVTPPTCTTSSFNGTTFPIYVPTESVEAYKSASGWSAYASRIYPIE